MEHGRGEEGQQRQAGRDGQRPPRHLSRLAALREPRRQRAVAAECGAELGAAGEVGVHRTDGQQHRDHRGDDATRRAEGHAEELGQRRLAGSDPRAEDEDARRDDAEVENADDHHRDHRGARHVPRRVAVVRGQRGDRLPSGEPPDDDRGGRSDGAPAVGGERGEVAEVRVRKGGDGRDGQQCGQQDRHAQLDAAGDPDAEPVEHRDAGDDESRRPHRRRPRPSDQIGHIATGERGGRRGAHGDDDVEEPAHGRGRVVTEGPPRIRGDPTGVGEPSAERRERQRERCGQDDERHPGQDRGRPGDPRRHGGQRDDAGAEDRANGEGGALGDGHP